MDALETMHSEPKPKVEPPKSKVSEIIESAARGSMETGKSVALGQDLRVESEQTIGAGLEFEGHVLQLTLFQKDEGEDSRGRKTSMSRASRRRDSIIR